jgi:hypothetical protein
MHSTPPGHSILTPTSRTATLVLAGLGAVGNAYAAIRIVTLWWTMRKETESEWEGSADIWTLDIARILGALVCTYMAIASVACAAGFYGTLKVCTTRRHHIVRKLIRFCHAATTSPCSSLS